ncbi:conserved hypothetical protein [Ricinus communis]|uniref:Uncharacterized protein n=1 Tax=Ricinus communis TaxID=3988 RepID=B9SA78_RICCO|nr:conserved hypothetical protein [Ricinus communis]|eukprot:XP_002522897.1 cyclic nucleotide-gated cation channel beta-1 [Ricinus communis]
MDQPENCKQQVQGLVILQSDNKYFVLKKTPLFLVTVSLFSLFLCFYSGFSILPNSFYVYFNTCLFSFLTRTLERKYMFLICNGILAFLAKTSVSSSSSPSGSDDFHNISPAKPTVVDDTVSKEVVALVAIVDEEETEKVAELAPATEEEEEEEEEKGEKEQEAKKGESEDMVAEDEGNGQEREVLEKQDEEDGQGEGEGKDELTNTEELNRRIEEFIRKMKEEIRIEAQQQLIAV